MSDDGPRPFVVRSLTESERARVRECLQWIHEQGAMWGPELDDRRIAEGYDRALAEARRRWPDVARLIGFDSDEPKERA
jgi:hypothetical protein